MSDKWIDCFNDKFEEFLKDLIICFPDDKDFKMFKHSFNLLKMVDKKQSIRFFRVYGPKYKEHINNKSEQFFLEHEFKEEIEYVQTLNSESNENITNQLMIKLKSYWKNLNNENKEVIWKYLQLLYKLDEKISI
tara:strand:+ start:501 stop:902 length:402 start_codon:yes stop_codon:yes gene_type:complete